MLDETLFRQRAETSLKALKQRLLLAESDEEFEVEEEQDGLRITLSEPLGTLRLTPNAAMRQITVTGPATHLQLDLDAKRGEFCLAKTGESMELLIARLLRNHLGGSEVLPT